MARQILSMYVLYFMMIWGFSPSMMAERFGSQCGQLEHQFFSAENMALKNFVYKNKTVANHVICGRDCGLEKDCRSFNFYKCRGFCEFSNATRKNQTEDFVEDQESLYFDRDENTPVHSMNDKTLECFRSCQRGIEKSGFYTICPDGLVNCQQIYCEMETTSVKESTTDQTTRHTSTEPTTHSSSTEPTTHPSSTEPTTRHLTSHPTTPFISTQRPPPKLSSCKAFFNAGYRESKAYTIYPSGFSEGLRVYCDMETDDGEWIVFQRRISDDVDFYRDWDDYKNGFGDPSGNFWLGNDNLAQLISAGYTDLRVDLESSTGTKRYAEYNGVSIKGSEYTFSYDNVDGNAADGLGDNKGFKFTTKDNDNDDEGGNCADTTRGGWWFKDCTVKSHLNGEYGRSGSKRGIRWYEISEPLKSCSMKLR